MVANFAKLPDLLRRNVEEREEELCAGSKSEIGGEVEWTRTSRSVC